MGADNGNLYALTSDGVLKWFYHAGVLITSPAIGADGTIYVGSAIHCMPYAIDPDGQLKWSRKIGYKSWGYEYGPQSSPAVGPDGTIYLGADDRKFYAIKPDGKIKWYYRTGGVINSSPAIGTDGTIYVGSEDGNFYAFNPDGTVKWSYATGPTAYSSPAIGTDGTIYVGGTYSLYALNPDGTFKWSYTMAGVIESSPAIGSDGIIYVGSFDGHLYAFNSSSSGLADSFWPMFRCNPARTGIIPPPVLTVALSGTGSGAVTSDPSGIACGATCVSPFYKGLAVTLTATPGADTVFSGWSGGCSGTGTCTITMAEDQSVGAAFNKVTCAYTISPVKKSFTYKGGHTVATVTASGADRCSSPDITASGSWLTATPVSFTGNKGSVRIDTSENTANAAREGTVAIGENSFAVTQKGAPCAIAVSPPRSALTTSAQSASFTVTAPSGCPWSAEVLSGGAWLSIPSTSGDAVSYA